MNHDFGSTSDGFRNQGVFRRASNGQPCSSVNGFMDYVANPNKWSRCSIEDFQKYYNGITNQQGSFCVQPLTTPNPNPNPSPAPNCARKSWISDGYCDPQTNNPQCFYDGQDCCDTPKRPDWRKFCGNVCIFVYQVTTTFWVFFDKLLIGYSSICRIFSIL